MFFIGISYDVKHSDDFNHLKYIWPYLKKYEEVLVKNAGWFGKFITNNKEKLDEFEKLFQLQVQISRCSNKKYLPNNEKKN
ncbi:hypothetical protein N9N67_02395 [Bacteriovoracaceae bacterium]|nr:hypothetical protein [Bacteriovoracaceae bacterium]